MYGRVLLNMELVPTVNLQSGVEETRRRKWGVVAIALHF
jgi:hypothetical protein